MAKANLFDNVFEKTAAEPAAEPEKEAEKWVEAEQPNEPVKAGGLFTLKNVPAGERKATTIIFSKRNYILLKTLAIKENLNMSEVVNRWLEGLHTEG